MTLNFYPAADGTLIDRETVRKFLVSNPSITTVCGGYNNLEFTRADANKGVGLRKLAEILGVNPDATMLEVEEAEAAIYNHDLTDVTDIITEILRDVRQNGQQLGQ